MPKRHEYILYTHKDAETNTLTDFVSLAANPAGIVSGIPEGVLARYSDVSGVMNIDRMWANYSPKTKELKQKYEQDKSFLEGKSLDNESLDSYSLKFNKLAFGTQLVLPADELRTDVLAFESDTQIVDHSTYSSFLADKLEELQGNDDFREVVKYRDVNLNVTQDYPQITVLIWCRSLSDPSDDSFQGKILNVSKLVRNLNTSVNANGGNFTFELAPVKGRYDSDVGWVLRDDFTNRDFVYEEESIMPSITGEMSDERFFFDSIINKNDIVFIAFEPLKIDDELRSEIKNSLLVSPQILPRGTFDMIGLVDNTFKSEDPKTADVRTSVKGRDLVKLLIDDGCWFFPYEFVPEGMVANTTDERWIQRHFGKLLSLLWGTRLSPQKSIQTMVQFVFNALSNISIAPDELFLPYGSERTLTFDADGGNEARGIWQIVKLVIDEGVTDRRVSDTSIGNELGSMMNFIRKICQSPWVEFFSDTYGSQFYFVVRQPPFSKKLFTELATRDDIISISEKDVNTSDLSFGKREAYSWYRIEPQPLIGGIGNDMGAAFLKAVHFPEYMEIYGDNPLDIVSNYIPYWPVSGQNKQNAISDIIKQGLYDLQYLVQSNAYNPFTRSGQIVLNGDRRIKYGTVVYYERTGEVFYVDNVTHGYRVGNNGIDRTTTLTVSRGMVKKHLSKYFEIIDTKIDESMANPEGSNSVDWSLKVQQNWKVNKEVFNFFLRKEQFS